MDTIAAVNRQPGALWRFLQFPLTRLVLAAVSIALVIALAQLLGGPLPRPVVHLLSAAAATAVYIANVRAIERRELVEFRLDGAGRETAMGLLIGAALFSVTMAILCIGGAWTLTGVNSVGAMGYPLVSALAAGVSEEILFRGVFFRIVEESLGSWIALALSAILFGLVHAPNPGATTVSTVAIALEAGILLAAGYMCTRRLWLVMALHMAWNFTEGGIFGTSVSGTEAHGLLAIEFHGPDLLTGGAFGPEASLVAVAVCMVAGATFLARAHRTNRIVRPFWRRS
ncbi:CPBP family intramembrane metalloprotease [Pendulispora rubella]|uniref:CPBP family intramembrane metalloprotease n=1 Tax=Pendulispora rubella TaxID=2741070 RepID=A0ABZ2KXY5_9BACT